MRPAPAARAPPPHFARPQPSFARLPRFFSALREASVEVARRVIQLPSTAHSGRYPHAERYDRARLRRARRDAAPPPPRPRAQGRSARSNARSPTSCSCSARRTRHALSRRAPPRASASARGTRTPTRTRTGCRPTWCTWARFASPTAPRAPRRSNRCNAALSETATARRPRGANDFSPVWEGVWNVTFELTMGPNGGAPTISASKEPRARDRRRTRGRAAAAPRQRPSSGPRRAHRATFPARARRTPTRWTSSPRTSSPCASRGDGEGTRRSLPPPRRLVRLRIGGSGTRRLCRRTRLRSGVRGPWRRFSSRTDEHVRARGGPVRRSGVQPITGVRFKSVRRASDLCERPRRGGGDGVPACGAVREAPPRHPRRHPPTSAPASFVEARARGRERQAEAACGAATAIRGAAAPSAATRTKRCDDVSPAASTPTGRVLRGGWSRRRGHRDGPYHRGSPRRFRPTSQQQHQQQQHQQQHQHQQQQPASSQPAIQPSSPTSTGSMGDRRSERHHGQRTPPAARRETTNDGGGLTQGGAARRVGRRGVEDAERLRDMIQRHRDERRAAIGPREGDQHARDPGRTRPRCSSGRRSSSKNNACPPAETLEILRRHQDERSVSTRRCRATRRSRISSGARGIACER